MKVQSLPDCNKMLGLANLPWPGLEGTAQLLWFVSIPTRPWSPGPHHTKDRKGICWVAWELSYSICIIVIDVQSLSHVQFFATSWTVAHQNPLFSTISASLLKIISIELETISNHLISAACFSFCLQSFPASGSFPMSRLFTSGGQSIGASASASVVPMNIQGWSPLGWTGWISLQSKGLSRLFSNTTVQKHQFGDTQLYSQYNSYIYTWPLEKP